MKTLALSLGLALCLPLAAQAACGPVSAGSFSDGCEQGVRVIRNQPLALPRLSPAEAGRIALQRERLALARQQASNSYALESRRLDQRDQALTQREYLYRDANSPLRERRFGRLGYRTFGGGYGIAYSPVVPGRLHP